MPCARQHRPRSAPGTGTLVSTATGRIQVSRVTDAETARSLAFVQHVLSERPVDGRLVTPRCLAPEPRHDLSVEPQRELVLDRSVEHATPRARPIAHFGYFGQVDVGFRRGRHRRKLFLLASCEP